MTTVCRWVAPTALALALALGSCAGSGAEDSHHAHTGTGADTGAEDSPHAHTAVGTGADDHHHASSGAPTRHDADPADAALTVSVDVVGGDPVGGYQRVEVGLGSVVALMVASDAADEIHVHGYDILRAVSEGHPADFAFAAEIPGVFEVELHGSGRLLVLLEVS